MIPRNISVESVSRALDYIDLNGVPKDRHSVKFSLKRDDKLYPPKFVISIAHKLVSGEEWPPDKFSGGQESNDFLENLGFEIIKVSSRPIQYSHESHSWKAISETVAVKILDKSSFLHHGSGVPRDFKKFFGLYELSYGQQVSIKLINKDKSFDAHFQMDKPLERMRLFWRSDFSDLLKETLPHWYRSFSENLNFESERPRMRFLKISDSEFQIEFIDPYQISADIDSEDAEEPTPRAEGAAKYSYSIRYERDSVNRRRAIEIHGCKCVICGFDFERVYGELGKGFIEIHHTKPLSGIEDGVVVDPETLKPILFLFVRIAIE